MADGRKEADGLLAAWHFAGVAGMFGAALDYREVNPFRVDRPVSPKLAELLEWRRKRRMRVLARDAAAAVKRG